MAARPRFVEEQMTCRRLAQDPATRWEFSRHALNEMQYDMHPPITQADIKHMLTRCQIVLVEFKKDVLWRAEGRDIDGRRFTTIVAVFEDEPRIKVVTVF